MRAKKFTAVIFVITIASFMCYVLAALAYEKISGKSSEYAAKKSVLKIDWRKLYPFENPQISGEKHDMNSFIKKYFRKGSSAAISRNLTELKFLIEAAKKYEQILGWNIVAAAEYNGVIKLSDGYLTNYVQKFDITHQAESIIAFSKFCESNGIDFCYVATPGKICRFEDANISGVLDFSNQNQDEFLAMLSNAGVKNYDLRENLHSDNLKHHESFYMTDHHWKAETGLWASRHILEFLRRDFSWKVDPDILKPENFTFKIYPKYFLGSQGKKVTLAKTAPEDFTLITPNFDTRLHFEVPNLRINETGDFMITCDMTQLERIDYYKLGAYRVYNRGRQPLAKIHNELLPNKTGKILMIKESYSSTVVPFIALGVTDIDAIDPRDFTGSIRNYIAKNKPDLVMVIYNPQMLDTTTTEYSANVFELE